MRELRHREVKITYSMSDRARMRVEQSHSNENTILIPHVEQENVAKVKSFFQLAHPWIELTSEMGEGSFLGLEKYGEENLPRGIRDTGLEKKSAFVH